MRKEDGRFVDVNGIRTHYYVKGDGPPLVLVHGGAFGHATAADSAFDWNLNFDDLAIWYRVIAIDKLGQGYTGNPKRDADSEPGYITLDEAIAADAVSLTETSESGNVPRIRLDNNGDLPVFLLDGEELVGAKQNRVLNVTILTAAPGTIESRHVLMRRAP